LEHRQSAAKILRFQFLLPPAAASMTQSHGKSLHGSGREMRLSAALTFVLADTLAADLARHVPLMVAMPELIRSALTREAHLETRKRAHVGNAAAHLPARSPYLRMLCAMVSAHWPPVGLVAPWTSGESGSPRKRVKQDLRAASFATDETHPGARSAPMTPPLWRGATL